MSDVGRADLYHGIALGKASVAIAINIPGGSLYSLLMAGLAFIISYNIKYPDDTFEYICARLTVPSRPKPYGRQYKVERFDFCN